MKKILLIGTGGTIASKNTNFGLSPLLSSNELINYVPKAKQFCNVDSIQLFNLDSTNIISIHWIEIVKLIKKNYDNYDGFVICHGTDTMAYTASALSYLIQNSRKPIVLTGSQKPIDMEITDAKTNLLDSLRFASCDKSCGVNIVFDGKVIAGTRGKKVRTKSYNAFSSINFPYIAIIQDEKIAFYIDNKRLIKGEPIFYFNINPKVFLLKLIPNISPKFLRYLSEEYDGLIIEAFGVGGVPNYDYENSNFYSEIKNLIDNKKTVVMTTQVSEEGSDMSVYEVGHHIKINFDILESYDMTLESTVTKLMWILSQTKDFEKIKMLFYTNINHDILLN